MEPPYPGCAWTLNHHMGVVNARFVYELLGAAVTYRDTPDPAARINEHIITSGIRLPPNVRSDTGQPDIWRDYQQVLSELGLMFSTEVLDPITPTALGLAFLDGSVSFSELMTLQALRLQYPNGHHNQISEAQRKALAGTRFQHANGLCRLQAVAGMQLRPAVLIWRCLRLLEEEGEQPRLWAKEIHTYLMRCSTHNDAPKCVEAIVRARRGGPALAPGGERQARAASEWIRFLLLTPLFSGQGWGTSQYLTLSPYAREHASELDQLCAQLESSTSFWMPGPGPLTQRVSPPERLSWYAWFGNVDLALGTVPVVGRTDEEEFPGRWSDEEAEEKAAASGPLAAATLDLRQFDPSQYVGSEKPLPTGVTIEASYDAALAKRSQRLHDQMVLLIHNVARARGADVLTGLADLVVRYRGSEFVVEVKSVTPRNFVQRLRYALGQVLHYDYLRSQESAAPGRRVVALTASVPDSMWCVSFLNQFLDVDLLSLDGRSLKVHSTSPLAHQLFGTEAAGRLL